MKPYRTFMLISPNGFPLAISGTSAEAVQNAVEQDYDCRWEVLYAVGYRVLDVVIRPYVEGEEEC